jgi:hypothetical protein
MSGDRHNTYISWAFLAFALFQSLIILFIGMLFALVLLLGSSDADLSAPVLALVFAFVMFIHVMMTLPSFIAWRAMKHKRPWARTAAIIAAALAAMNAPIGTAVAVYALWFFVGDEWKSVYEMVPEQLPSPEPYSFASAYDTASNEVDFALRHPPDWR